MTRVVHVDKEPFDIYIGRSFREFGESIWHNPFKLGRDGDRKEVLAKYREYILSKPELYTRLHELTGKTLGCWCKKKGTELCHGDVLAELADRPMQNIHNLGLVPEGVTITFYVKHVAHTPNMTATDSVLN